MSVLIDAIYDDINIIYFSFKPQHMKDKSISKRDLVLKIRFRNSFRNDELILLSLKLNEKISKLLKRYIEGKVEGGFWFYILLLLKSRSNYFRLLIEDNYANNVSIPSKPA